jgi:hypothetical protein
VSVVGCGGVLCSLLSPFLADRQDSDRGFAARLSADGQRFLARSPQGFVQIWDVESCQELSEPLWHQATTWATQAAWSPDGARILTLDNDGIARVWDLPETAAADSAPLADLAEAAGGLAVDSTGSAAPLPDPVARLNDLRALRARANPPGRPPALALQVIRWFFADPAARTLSPFSTLQAHEPAPGPPP